MDAAVGAAPPEFQKAVMAYMPKLKSFAMARTGNSTDAEDLVQETVLKALSKHYQFQPGTSLGAWLTTICRNEHFTKFRKRRNEIEDADGKIADAMTDDSSDDGESRDELSQVMRLLETLDPVTKAIMLDMAEGSSYAEIAEKHGIPEGTVKSRINRAKQVLLAARNDTLHDAGDFTKAPEGLQEITTPVYVQPIIAPADLGNPPILRWLPITSLRLDPTYQREMLDRGKANVARIARAFDWNKFGTVIVASLGGGIFSIIDGQHRTTAAKLCGITDIPCQVIDATTAQQAEAFAAINGNVTALTPMQIHHAKIAAGDKEALQIEAVCNAADVAVLRYPVPANKIGPAQTMAIGAIRMALRKHGVATLAVALSCLSKTRGGNPGLYRQQIILALAEVLSKMPSLVADPQRAIDKARTIRFAHVWQEVNIEAKRARKPLLPILRVVFEKSFNGPIP